MSDHVVQSDNDSDGTARDSTHLCQSVWMAHWMHTSYKPETLGHDHREDGDGKQLGLEIPSHIIKSPKGVREISEPKTVNIMNESLKPNSAKFGKERLQSQSFPKFNLSQNRDSVMTPRNVTTCHGIISEMGNSSGEGISGNPELLVKSLESIENKSLAVSTSFHHDVGSSSKIVPYGYNGAKSHLHSVICRQEDINEPSNLVASKEHVTTTKFQTYSTSLVHEKKTNNPSDFIRSGTSSSRQNNLHLLLYDPSASNNELPVFVDKQCKDRRIHSGTSSFPNRTGPLDSTRSGIIFHDFISVPRIPRAVHDAQTMRICSTADSRKELSGRSPMFSQTTHHFMITKKTGLNLSDGGQMFRDSTFSANIKGKILSKFLSSSSGFGFHGQRDLKLKPFGSSTDIEEKENFGDVRSFAVCLKNESSAETDTMDMDVLQKDHNSGVVSSPTDKISRGGQMASTSQAAIAPARVETGGRLPSSEIPDINEELPALPAVPNSENDKEASTSRTHSLDMDHLLSHAELPTNSKSSAVPDGHGESEPSIRWIKRLKLSASDTFAHGTKSFKLEEASRHEKVSKLFSKILSCSTTSSELTMDKCSGKEPIALDQTAMLLRNGESSLTKSVRKTQDLNLLNPWIMRWCHCIDVSPAQNHDAVVACEPQSSNATLDGFQKKQFPSIAAMALMGKAVNTFQTCEFRKRGTYIVWNT